MRPSRRAFILIALALLAGCGPKIEVKPIGTRVDPAPPVSPAAAPAAEKALPPALPGGWKLSGGPADYTAATAGEALGDEAGRFRGLTSYAVAEYMNLAQRVISLESFQMSSADAAGAALSLGRPEAAKSLDGNDIDGGFVLGMKAEARKGALLVRVRWFEGDDRPLADAAEDALRDALAAGVAGGIAGVPTPVPSLSPLAPAP